MVWSGSRPACLPLPFICLPVLFICLPGWVLVVGFPAGLSPTSFHLSPTSFHLSPSSFHLSPRLGACSRQSGSWLACLPLPFICLPGSVLVVGFPAGLSPTSFHLSPTSPRLGACCRVPAWLVSLLFICPTSFQFFASSFHLSSRLGPCGRVPAWLVSHFLSFASHFFSFPRQFTVLNSFLRFVRPLCQCWCPPFSAGHVAFLFICLPGLSLLVSALFRWPCSISIHLSPRSVAAGVHPFPLSM